MDIAIITGIVTGITGFIAGIIGAIVTLRKQALSELSAVIAARGEEIKRLSARIDELERDNADLRRRDEAKSAAIADLVARLNDEMELRNEREAEWAEERRRLLRQIECLKKELAELKVAWANGNKK